jgi:hypothetical protein
MSKQGKNGIDAALRKQAADKAEEQKTLSGKESEDLFKLAFRNYLNLVALADRKAGLLIQVNSIIASVIIGLTIRNPQDYFALRRGLSSIFLAIPAAIFLLVAAITIILGILASKPLDKYFIDQRDTKEPFFFGSFDRLDPKFKNVTWEKYAGDIDNLFRGEKKNVFDELIKESFQVRKVLSRKFGYLALAYKIFFTGFLTAVITLILAFVQGE